MERSWPEFQLEDYSDFLGTTYKPGLDWLLETCETIEDWGCGTCKAREYVPRGRYRGIDGSPDAARFGAEIRDLREYTSSVDGVFMRYVLEHNPEWRVILANVMGSFRKRFVLVTYTPFGDETHALNPGGMINMSFRKDDITGFFTGCDWQERHFVMPDAWYGFNDMFLVERRSG